MASRSAGFVSFLACKFVNHDITLQITLGLQESSHTYDHIYLTRFNGLLWNLKWLKSAFCRFKINRFLLLIGGFWVLAMVQEPLLSLFLQNCLMRVYISLCIHKLFTVFQMSDFLWIVVIPVVYTFSVSFCSHVLFRMSPNITEY